VRYTALREDSAFCSVDQAKSKLGGIVSREPRISSKPLSSTIGLGHRFWRWLYRRAELHTIEGVPVGILWPSSDERSACLAKFEAALRLLADHDPRRFERFRRNVSGVLVFDTTGALAQWVASIRLVVVHLNYVMDPETSSFDLASTLVHEGAHAWLDGLGFSYEPACRARIEAICFRSEISFARRNSDSADLIARAERQLARDPSYWTPAAFRHRSLGELNALGLPRWFTKLLDRMTRDAA
jgi:hypothetical protein